jgi:crotonobetainyl-CoA hydratase
MTDGAGVTVRIADGIAEITIDRPKANAIDAATSRRLGEAFAAFRDDPAQRVAILTGAGTRFFSAGWDLKAARRARRRTAISASAASAASPGCRGC